MRLKQLVLGCAISVLIMATGPAIFSQEAVRDFAIKNILTQPVESPTYGGNADLGGRPATLWRNWLKIEVQFESRPAWADDVQIQYYVLAGQGEGRKVFVGDVTHINVAKGSQHFSAMFMQPNTLKRYGINQIDQITVRLFDNKKKLVSTMSVPPNAREGWWDRFTPTPGYLLPPQDTPWAPIADQRFEAVKPNTRP